jgi:hypothetical protein
MNSPQPQMRSPQRLQIAGPPDCYHERDSDQTNQQDGSWEKDLKQQAIKEEEWGRHKQNFRDLYLTDGFKLNDVRRLMYQQYGFYAT